MDTHRKVRIEVIIESPLENRLIEVLDKLSVKGYTLIPAIAGRGHDGTWRREGLVGGAGHMIVMLCIVDPSRSKEIVTQLYELVGNQIGIINVSEVNVIRGEHF